MKDGRSTIFTRTRTSRKSANSSYHHVDPESGKAAVPTLETKEISSLKHRKYWGIGAFRFRFSLSNFLPGRNISQRRFGIIEATLMLMMAYIASRGLGVVRQTIFNALFGTGLEANAFYAAFRVPDTLFNLIAGGALSYALIPVFISYEKENGRQEVWRLASLVFNVLLVTLTALILIGEFLAPAFVTRLLVPGYPPSEQALVTTLTRIMLIQPLILGLGTIATAILSSKRQFLLPALSIAVYNFGMLAGLLLSLTVPGVGIYGPTYGVLVAATFQVLIQVPGLRKEGLRYSFIWDLRHRGLHEVMRLLVPNTLGVAMASAALILDTAYASYLPDQASLAALHNAQLLYDLPLALFAQAVAQAALPRLSALAALGRYVRLRQLTLRVIGIATLLSILGAILLCLLGKPAIRILFQHGAFTSHSSALTTLALLGYAIGLPANIAGELLARSFYALKDARTPLIISIFNLVAHFGLVLLLLRVMTGGYVILAIPLAASGAVISGAILLCVLLFFRLQVKVKADKAMLRLEQRRKFASSRASVAIPLVPAAPQ